MTTALTVATILYVAYRIARAFARAGDAIRRARADFGGIDEWERTKRDLAPRSIP